MTNGVVNRRSPVEKKADTDLLQLEVGAKTGRGLWRGELSFLCSDRPSPAFFNARLRSRDMVESGDQTRVAGSLLAQ